VQTESVDRWGLVRVAVQDHCPLCSRQSRDAISGPDVHPIGMVFFVIDKD
jgi:hypothetical protein